MPAWEMAVGSHGSILTGAPSIMAQPERSRAKAQRQRRLMFVFLSQSSGAIGVEMDVGDV
jgi:hypothetical protein